MKIKAFSLLTLELSPQGLTAEIFEESFTFFSRFVSINGNSAKELAFGV